MKRYLLAYCAIALAFVPAACSMHGQSAVPALSSGAPPNAIQPFDLHGGIASMQVSMSDAAPVLAGKELAHFNVAIREIDVTDAKGRSQVLAQYSSPLIVDVLQYQTPQGAPVGANDVNTQTFSQLRFVVDVAASQAIFTDDSSSPLNFVYGANTSSSANAGATTSTVPAGPGLVAITDRRPFAIGSTPSELVSVDFNLFESLAASNDRGKQDGVSAFDTHGGIASLSVRPSLFVAANATAGEITGRVVNQNAQAVSGAVVVAIGPGGVGNSASTDAAGNFEMHSLAAGSYRLRIYNSYTNAAGAQFTSHGASFDRTIVNGPGINVLPGAPTSAGTITD